MIGRLLGHKQQATEDGSSPITGDFIIGHLEAEVHAANNVAGAILMLAGELPISKELIAQFKEAGLSLEKLELKDIDE